MLKRPERTFETDLSEDELILLDGLFEIHGSIELLSAENFSEATELPYTHHLSRAELIQTIDALRSKHMVSVSQTMENEIVISLTEMGGAIWNRERQPDWQHYCRWGMKPEWDEDENEVWYAYVHSPNLDLAHAFLETAIESGVFVDVQLDSIETKEYSHVKIIDWWVVDKVYVLEARCGSVDDDMPINWELYERRRKWWSNLMELGGLPA